MIISGKRHELDRREFKLLPTGGYICRIVACEFGKNRDGHDVLILNVDIVEGEFKGYFQNFADRFDYWHYGAIFRRKVFGANGEDFADSFQQTLEDIEDSNDGFKFDDDNINESDFVGKLCGFIFGDKEYRKKDGGVGISPQITFSKSVKQIREGKFKIPPTKKLTESPPKSTVATDEPPPLVDEISETDSLDLDDLPL